MLVLHQLIRYKNKIKKKTKKKLESKCMDNKILSLTMNGSLTTTIHPYREKN